MEDFTNILWLLAILGSVAVSLVGKYKADKDKQAAPAQPFAQEGSETESGPQAADRTLGHVPAPENSEPQQIYRTDILRGTCEKPILSDSSDISSQSEMLWSAESADRPSERMAAYTSTEPETALKQQEVMNHADLIAKETAEASNPMDGFNLQKAVIWSEVLKPKFDEE